MAGQPHDPEIYPPVRKAMEGNGGRRRISLGHILLPFITLWLWIQEVADMRDGEDS